MTLNFDRWRATLRGPDDDLTPAEGAAIGSCFPALEACLRATDADLARMSAQASAADMADAVDAALARFREEWAVAFRTCRGMPGADALRLLNGAGERAIDHLMHAMDGVGRRPS